MEIKMFFSFPDVVAYSDSTLLTGYAEKLKKKTAQMHTAASSQT